MHCMSVPQLTEFYSSILGDNRINARHISLYMALFECWNKNNFQNPVGITRHIIMPFAKISGIATYHKCMKELHEYGYIKYIPSYNPAMCSEVFLLKMEKLHDSIEISAYAIKQESGDNITK